MNHIRIWLLTIILLLGLGACARQQDNQAVKVEIDAVLSEQADPRPYATKFRHNYELVCDALRRQSREPVRCAQALAWLYYEWGDFNTAWSFLTLERVDEYDVWGKEVARRLILLRGEYEIGASESLGVAAEKRWALHLLQKMKSGELTVHDVRGLCRPDSVGLLSAYALASRRALSATTANTLLAGLQGGLFAMLEVSDWDGLWRRREEIPEDLMVDCAVVFAVLEDAGLGEVLPVVTAVNGRSVLSSKMLVDVLQKKETIAPMLRAYHQGIERLFIASKEP